MAIAKDVKKSQFIEVLSNETTDRFDFTRGSQNLAISFVNLAASLGVSGTLSSLGEITAIPVLQQIGGVNYIRALLAGSGIAVDVSPQNGIEISHNFTVDNGGVPIMINEGSSSPIFRSIEGGTGINVSGSGNSIQIATSGIPASTKTVVIYGIDDFPAPVAGVITLLTDTEYKLQNDVSSANRFVMAENTVLSGADGSLIELEYTGSGTMFTASDVNFKIKDIILRCDSGTLFDMSSSTGAHRFRQYTCNCYCNNIGSIDGMGVVYFFSVVFLVTTQGMTFSNNNNVVIFDTSSFTIASGAGNAIDLGTATFSVFTIDKAISLLNTSGYFLTGLTGSGNINANGLGSIINTRNLGTSPLLNNISPYDDSWEIQLNSEVMNSLDLCLMTHGGATVAITALATPAIIGATWTEHQAHRFTTTAGGRFTYDGKGTHVSITASISADIVTATDNCSFFLYLNGAQITASRVIRSLTAGSIGNIVLIWAVELETSDYLEIWVQNDDTNVDINIYSATVRIRS